MGEPVISVVVPSYRPGTLLAGCVEALLRQEVPVPYEVIVVDSTADGTAERLAARFPACRTIALETRTPQAMARNIGVAAARGEYVALTDHDCLVPPDWLARLLRRHAAGEYAAVGGAVANGTPHSLVGTAAYWIEFNDFTSGRRAGPVAQVPHCNVCFRRAALASDRPFPALPPCAEDLTFNYLLTTAGETIFFDPEIVVTHLNRTRLDAFLSHQYELGRGSAIARRLVPLPGAVFVRHPVLAPALPLVRLGGTVRRVAGRHPGRLPLVSALLPLLLAGYACWTAGFLNGRRLPLEPAWRELDPAWAHRNR